MRFDAWCKLGIEDIEGIVWEDFYRCDEIHAEFEAAVTAAEEAYQDPMPTVPP